MDDSPDNADARGGWIDVIAKRWHRPRGFAALLLLLVVASNYRVVIGMETFVLRDFSLFGYPLAHHAKESLLRGEIPLWNPMNDCGLPFLAQWNTMVLYPPALLNLLLPLSWSLGVFCMLHQYVAGLGMYFLALRWTRSATGAAFAGVAFAFCGIMQTSLMWPNNIAALGCLPWVVLVAQSAWRRGGRWVAFAALLAGMQLLTGAPEIILVTWLLAGTAWLSDLRSKGTPGFSFAGVRLGIVILVASLLAAAQLIPFFDLLNQSARWDNPDEITWAIGLNGWVNFFLPQFDCIEPQATDVLFHKSQAWTHSYYAGLLPWLLLWPAIAGRRLRMIVPLVALVPLAILLAMGPEGKLYSAVHAVLPLDVMRFPVKFTVICAVVLPLVGAFGLRGLRRKDAFDRGIQSMIWVALVLVAVGWLLSEEELTDAERTLSWSGYKLRLVWLVLSAGAALLFIRTVGMQRSLSGLCLVIVLQTDLQWHQPALSPTIDRRYYELPNPAAERFIGAQYPFGRSLPGQAAQDHHLKRPSIPFPEALRETRGGLFSNLNLLDGVAKVNGFYSMWLPRFGDVIWAVYDGPFELHPSVADYMSITRTTSRKGPMDWANRPSAMPPVTAGQEPVFVPVEDMPKIMRAIDFDPRKVILLAPGTESLIGAENQVSASVSNLVMKPHEIRFQVSTPEPTIVNISQSHYHHWKAYVDGSPTPIHLANGAFQALDVPAGEFGVELFYEDRGFVLGAWISGLSLSGCFFWLVAGLVRQRKSN